MSLFEDLFKMEGATGPAVLVGALLIAPAVLRPAGRAFRPVAKEAIKAWISAYDEARADRGKGKEPPEAAAQGRKLVLKMLSEAARSIPELTPDEDGLLSVSAEEVEEVLNLLEAAGVEFIILG